LANVERALACHAGDLPIANGFTAPCGRARGREGIPIWRADRLQAVKWRNFKVHFYRQDTMVSPPMRGGLAFALLIDGSGSCRGRRLRARS
jgi:hypothetical protein